jgi:putative photosynthetic complex assembly protein 2
VSLAGSLELHALPIAATIFLWWFGTGIVLWLDGRPRATHRTSILLATVGFAVAMLGILATAGDTTARGAYLAFAAGVVVWGWQEMLFLMGYVTGPRRGPCPPGAHGWRRFVVATETVIHHELALGATALALVAVTWGAPNQTGTWTFLVLWVMRLSAKINVFLGVRNLSEEFLPENLRYLQTYFRARRMNWFFPFAVTAATVGAVFVWQAAFAAATTFEAVSRTLVASMLSLAVIEHWFLILPMTLTALWQGAIRPAPEAAPVLDGTAAAIVDDDADHTLRPARARRIQRDGTRR